MNEVVKKYINIEVNLNKAWGRVSHTGTRMSVYLFELFSYLDMLQGTIVVSI